MQWFDFELGMHSELSVMDSSVAYPRHFSTHTLLLIVRRILEIEIDEIIGDLTKSVFRVVWKISI